MVELTEDRNGKFNVDYVLDDTVTPEVRREAALQAQQELANRMQEWGISLLNAPVPEQMKYASLAVFCAAKCLLGSPQTPLFCIFQCRLRLPAGCF